MDLEKLRDDIIGLNPTICTHLKQACAECLEYHEQQEKNSFTKTNSFKVN